MRTLVSLFAAILVFAGCQKDSTNPVSTAPTTSTSVFTSGNVKLSPVYFSFAKGDSVSAADQWDLKLTTLYDATDLTNSYPFPGIALNPQTNAQATLVDGQTYDSVDPTTVTGLRADKTGFVTFTTANIKNGPVYFSFSNGDTTTSSLPWDIQFTVDATRFPLVILNRQKSVEAAFKDTSASFAAFNQYSVSDNALKTDPNDTTFVIGSNSFSYDPNTHILSPYADREFVVKTTLGEKVKFHILSYYNASGASGYVTFEYYSKSKENYPIGTNCLSYDGTTHILSPYNNRTFVVQTSTGKRAKFKMLTYYNDAGASGYMKFQFDAK
jgi:hypothetical protein